MPPDPALHAGNVADTHRGTSTVFFAKTSAGVFQPRHLRGVAFIRSVISRMSVSVICRISRSRGSHLRARWEVFSTVPCWCRDCGSRNKLRVPVSARKCGQVTDLLPLSNVTDRRAAKGRGPIAATILLIIGLFRMRAFVKIAVTRLTRSTSEVTLDCRSAAGTARDRPPNAQTRCGVRRFLGETECCDSVRTSAAFSFSHGAAVDSSGGSAGASGQKSASASSRS